MRLKSFRIQMYKCIIDSGWIEVTPLTALIGKNESGKTSLLKSLYKFNPFKKEEVYSLETEWPRRFRKKRNADQVVCSTRFELTDQELTELSSLTGQTVTEKEVELSRTYSGKLTVHFPPGLFPDKHSLKDIEEICGTFPNVQEPVSEAFRQKANEYIEEARQFANEGRFGEIVKMFSAKVTELRATVNPDTTSAERKNEEAFILSYANQISVISRKLAETPTIHDKAQNYIIQHLPTFIYMSDYRIFSGNANLVQVKERKEQNKLTEDDQTFLTILDLAGLNLEKLIDTNNPMDREQRQYDLADASTAFTKTIAGRWRQSQYEVQFNSDGQYFYTFVKGLNDSALIRLEERSKGFQWFFSFDLMFMNESQGTFKNCVILLDEPGLHLHPQAQLDLVQRLNEYSKDNIIIYTTHLPMMLDLTRPESLRTLSEQDLGTIVGHSFAVCQREAKIVLETALKMKSGLHCLPNADNLLVPCDAYRLLDDLLRLWERSGEADFIENWFLLPYESNSEALYTHTLLEIQGFKSATLLNSDPDGLDLIKAFQQNWPLNLLSRRSSLVLLGECCGKEQGEFFIEDCFPEEYYLSKINQIYRKQLAVLGLEKLEPLGDGSIINRFQNAAEQIGLCIDRNLINKAIHADLRKMQTIQELPELTRNLTASLIRNIRLVFENNVTE